MSPIIKKMFDLLLLPFLSFTIFHRIYISYEIIFVFEHVLALLYLIYDFHFGALCLYSVEYDEILCQ